jgi:hypothetical protein
LEGFVQVHGRNMAALAEDFPQPLSLHCVPTFGGAATDSGAMIQVEGESYSTQDSTGRIGRSFARAGLVNEMPQGRVQGASAEGVFTL